VTNVPSVASLDMRVRQVVRDHARDDRLLDPAADMDLHEPSAEENLGAYGKLVAPAARPALERLHDELAVAVRANHLLSAGRAVAASMRWSEPAVAVVASIPLKYVIFYVLRCDAVDAATGRRQRCSTTGRGSTRPSARSD
jgi:hypothetical protein